MMSHILFAIISITSLFGDVFQQHSLPNKSSQIDSVTTVSKQLSNSLSLPSAQQIDSAKVKTSKQIDSAKVKTSQQIDSAVLVNEIDKAAKSSVPMSVVDKRTMEQVGAVQMSEVINLLSGVSLKDYGGLGGLKTVSFRNLRSSHTAIIYDGIPISNAQNGQVDISRFNLDNISEINSFIGFPDEIFQSARLSPASGVLKIETASPFKMKNNLSISSRMTCASFNTYNPSLNYVQRINSNYAISAYLNFLSSKSDYPYKIKNGNQIESYKRENSDIISASSELNFYSDMQEKGRIKAKTSFYYSDRGLPGAVILYADNDWDRLVDRSVLVNLSYDCDFNEEWRFHTDLNYNYNYNYHTDYIPAKEDRIISEYLQNEFSISARAKYGLNEYWSFVVAEDLVANTLETNILGMQFPVRLNSQTAITAQWHKDNLKFTASLAGQLMKEKQLAKTSNADNANLQGGPRTKNFAHISPVLQINWKYYRDYHLRFSVKDSYIIPTFNDLYYARVGNPDLLPEKSLQFNIGTVLTERFNAVKMHFSADAYYFYLRDKIVAIPTMFIWKMHNLGRVDMLGLDLDFSSNFKICSYLELKLAANYSYQYAVDVTSKESKNYKHQIPYTPKNVVNSFVTLSFPWFNLTYKLSAMGERYFREQNIELNRMEPFCDHNISLNSKQICVARDRLKLSLSFGALNLSNNNYFIINYYPMPGRSYRMTIRLSY